MYTQFVVAGADHQKATQAMNLINLGISSLGGLGSPRTVRTLRELLDHVNESMRFIVLLDDFQTRPQDWQWPGVPATTELIIQTMLENQFSGQVIVISNRSLDCRFGPQVYQWNLSFYKQPSVYMKVLEPHLAR